jgi:hypothetical protein
MRPLVATKNSDTRTSNNFAAFAPNNSLSFRHLSIRGYELQDNVLLEPETD